MCFFLSSLSSISDIYLVRNGAIDIKLFLVNITSNDNIDGLVQERRISRALAMGLLLSYTKSSAFDTHKSLDLSDIFLSKRNRHGMVHKAFWSGKYDVNTACRSDYHATLTAISVHANEHGNSILVIYDGGLGYYLQEIDK